uniref:Uncharacterized protein n=1 Tax=Triticum urartu TaxID=4572 RepID=A0A8R7PTH4_TRIUA
MPRRVEHQVRLQQALRAVLPVAVALRPLGDHLLHGPAEVLVRVGGALHHGEAPVRGGGRRGAPRHLEAVAAALRHAAARGGRRRAAGPGHGRARLGGVLARAVVEVGRVGGEAPGREEVPRVLVVLIVGGGAAQQPARGVRRQPAPAVAGPLLPPRQRRQRRRRPERRGGRALAALPLARPLERRPLRLDVVGVERREEGRVGRVDGAAAGAVDGDADHRGGAARGDGEAAVVVLACRGLLAPRRPEAAVGGQCEGRRRGLVVAALPAARAPGEDRQDGRQPVLELLAADAGAGAVHRAGDLCVRAWTLDRARASCGEEGGRWRERIGWGWFG